MDTVSWLSAGMGDVPRRDDWLDDALSGRLRAMRHPRRRAEARLSRWVAKSAIARMLGHDPGDMAVLHHIVIRDPPNAPLEAFVDGDPAGVSIAQTEAAGWAVCALAGPRLRLGCDLAVLDATKSEQRTANLPASDQRLVTAPDDGNVVAGLVSSAKESAVEVLRPELRQGPVSMEVDLTSDVRAAWGQLTVHGANGAHYPGWWRRFDRLVLTVVADAPFLPPKSLVRPPPLTAATDDG